SGKGVLAIVKGDIEVVDNVLVVASAGIVDYIHGEVILNTINFTSTERSNNIIEIQAFPESNDVIGLKDLYLSFAVGDSSINMVKDTITSGEQISGVGYKVTSSYANGALVRG
ncbi:MAG: baseplate wedge protein, partial [Pseudomonadota bacterium]|nr:baseplate wedge protein [Pseudomonadota bacterium]